MFVEGSYKRINGLINLISELIICYINVYNGN